MPSHSHPPKVIGIDLGTSNTCAGHTDGRIPRMIPTERGHNVLASVVAFVGGKTLLGQPARDQLLINPAETIYGSKRLLGRAYSTPQVSRLKRHFAYNIVEGNDGNAAVLVDGRVRNLTEVSAMLLAQIARYAEAHLKSPIDGAVISVPAYYPNRQREAVRKAAENAGLDVWRLVNEPTAAALAYGVGRGLDQKVLVFDLGGGTFDVSILEIQGGTFHVLATGGDGFLGGVDFDISLTESLLQSFESAEGVPIREDPVVVQRVMAAAEAAKCDLSLLRHTDVRLPFVTERRGKPLDLQVHVSREELEGLTSTLLDRCLSLVDQVLGMAGLEPKDIDEVLLAGGQTRMPAIQQRLEKHFGFPPRRGVHPDEVVAQGASLLARSLGTSDVLRLLDVLSVPIGYAKSTDGGERVLAEIIGQNEMLPVDAEVSLPTTAEGQQSMEIDLYQGTPGEPVAKADYLGTALVDGIPSGPAGAHRASLKLSMNTDGFLEVKGAPNDATGQVLTLLTRPQETESPFSIAPKTEAGEAPAGNLLRRLLRR